MPTLTPCSRKPAAEAEAEIGWLAGWLAGRLAGLGDVSDTSWGTSPGRLPELGWGVLEGGGQKGAKVLKSGPFCILALLSHFGAPHAKIMELSSKTHFLHFWAPKVAKYRYEYKPFRALAQKV